MINTQKIFDKTIQEIAEVVKLINEDGEADTNCHFCNNHFHFSKEELIELLNLKEFLKTPVRQLSLGQRMRCEIAASLLHNPKILFLDEPTIGLDAASKKIVRDFILKINSAFKHLIHHIL